MDIHQSLDAIRSSQGEFAETFYNRLAEDQPEIFRHFDGIDMKQQAHMLTIALFLIVADFEKPCTSIQEYLRVLGTRHHHRKIDQQLFAQWQETLLATLADFHATAWSRELALQWQSAIEAAIQQMFVGYDENHHV